MEPEAMRITVTVRHTELPDELRERAVELVDKATSLAHRPQHAEVIFDADHGKRGVEIRFTQTGGSVKVAHAEADDFRSALDAAVQKLRSQLDKNSGRPRRIPS